MVLIDAAKGCATEPLDLARYPADFVVFSFYKVYPNKYVDPWKFWAILYLLWPHFYFIITFLSF